MAFKMWLFPWLSYLVVASIIGILAMMLIMPGHRMEVMTTGALAIAIVCMSSIFSPRKRPLPRVATKSA